MAIKQRISLEGSEDIRKNLEQLGKTGEQAFKQIQGATEAASASLLRFRLAALGIVTAVTAVASAISALTKGAGETARELSEQADALGLTDKQWIGLRRSIDAAGGSIEEFVNSTQPLLRNLNQLSAQFSGRSVQTFADGASVTVHQIERLSEQSKGLLAILQKFGVRRDIIDKGSVAIMEELARLIDGMPEGTAKATAGLQFFGAKWRDVVNSLTIGFKSVGDAETEMDNKRRASRQLTEEQVKSAKQAADQWEDFAKAIRAAKDVIGSVFSGGSFAKAKWLTDLVDDSRMLLQTWGKLDAAGKKIFLAGLGDSAAEKTFKVLVSLSQQLGAVWRVVVSAGEKLMGVFEGIASAFEGITGSQVAAFFLTAATAAAGLAIALKGIALVLAPLSLLGALFSPLGAVLVAAAAAAALFWDELKAGAASVAALIPQELEQIKSAIAKLFTGDFTGAWAQFSAAAVSAFQKIKEAAKKTEIGKALIEGFEQFVKDLPGTIVLIVKSFIALGKAAQGVADIINKVFGTKLTGTDIVAVAIIGTLISGFVAVAAVVTIVGTAITTLASLFGGPVTAAILVATAAATLFATYWPQIKQAAIDAGNAIQTKWQELKALFDAWVTTPVGNAWQWIKDTFNDAVSYVSTKIDEAKALVDAWVTTPVANAWQWIKDAFNDALEWIQQKWASVKQTFGFGGGGGGGAEAGSIPGNAAGGLIGGRGSGTSDSNLAWVSRGEHIMPARAVRQPGVLELLEALRRTGGNLRGVMNGMGRFAMGGLVPRFAEGGLVGGMQHLGTVDLRTDHGTARLMASSTAVEQLTRLAVTKRMTSTGKKPGFIG